MNGPLVAGPQGGASGPNGRMRSGKDRAHSEKTGSTSAGGAAAGGSGAQGYHASNPSQSHGGGHHQLHSQGASGGGYLHQNPHHTPNVGNYGPGAGGVPHQTGGKSSIGSSAAGAQKKVKMQKPTINLSINNNVQNVIVTPLGSGQYPNSHHHGGAQNLGSSSGNNMGGQHNGGG